MDEYFCNAYPDPYVIDLVSEKPSSPKDQCFNVEIKRIEMHVLNARKLETFEEYKYHSFKNISKDEMMQETTILGWLSSMGVPKDAHKIVIAKILECARCMALWTHKDKRVLYMRVDVTITLATEDCDDSDNDNDDDSLKESEESNYDYDNGDDEGDDGSMGEDEDEDPGLEPASKSSIEGLETVKVEMEEQEGCVNCGKCAICFEDFDVVGVRMPCLHKFHRNCIVDWLRIGSSCPLCRFQMPTEEGEREC